MYITLTIISGGPDEFDFLLISQNIDGFRQNNSHGI